jgi:hypothetical protein
VRRFRPILEINDGNSQAEIPLGITETEKAAFETLICKRHSF